MKEKEIQEKIEELQKQLEEKKKKKQKKIVVEEDKLSVVLYILVLGILIFILEGVLNVFGPYATILSIIGSFTIVLGLSYILMISIKCLILREEIK